MALDDTFTVDYGGQEGTSGAVDALHIEQYGGEVELTIARRSVLENFFPTRPLRGSSVAIKKAVGSSTLQKVTPGARNDGTKHAKGKNSVDVDTVILARAIVPILSEFQTDFNHRMALGQEHGKTIAKFHDKTLFTVGIRAALATSTFYSGSPTGFSGGSQVTLAGSTDYQDPALLYQAIVDLLVKMEKKDVDPVADGVVISVRPDEFAVLEQSEFIINKEYITSDGNRLQGASLLKARGVPVVSSNNFPALTNITTGVDVVDLYGSTYEVDASKVIVTAFAPKAVLAAETIPLTHKVWWSDDYLQWCIDSYFANGAAPDRAEWAGAILLP